VSLHGIALYDTQATMVKYDFYLIVLFKKHVYHRLEETRKIYIESKPPVRKMLHINYGVRHPLFRL